MTKPNLGSSERDRYGATVTLVRLDSRLAVVETTTVAYTGMSTKDALREVAAACDRREGDWRVRTVSTPVTIERDMQGARMSDRPGGYADITHDSSERHALGLIGRKDLLELPPRDFRRTQNARARAEAARDNGTD